MDADYSSDEADLTWSGRSRSRDHTSESAKAAKKAKQTAKAMQKDAADAADNSKGFFGEHLSQIVVAALVAGGAAAVYFLKQKSTDKTSGEKDSESATSAKPTPGRTQAADTKKPAMRRKRSEQVPDLSRAESSIPNSPRHKHARHEDKPKPSATAAQSSSRLTKPSSSRKLPDLPDLPVRSSKQRSSGQPSSSATATEASYEAADSCGSMDEENKSMKQHREQASDSKQQTAVKAKADSAVGRDDGSSKSAGPEEGTEAEAFSSSAEATAGAFSPAKDKAETSSSTQDKAEASSSSAKDRAEASSSSAEGKAEASSSSAKAKADQPMKKSGKRAPSSEEEQGNKADANGNEEQKIKADAKGKEERNTNARDEAKEKAGGNEGADAADADEEGGPPEPATGQEDGSEAVEEAEKDVKAAAEAMNKQLPKEAQAGSMMPLTEETKSKEKEEGGEASEEKKQQQQDQVLDTFDVEIEALDTSRRPEGMDESSSETVPGKGKGGKADKDNKEGTGDKDAKGKQAGEEKEVEGRKKEEGEDEDKADTDKAADKPDQAEQDSAKSKSAADADQGKSKADKDKSEAGKEAASDESEGGKEGMNPEENVPVRLESEPLEEPGSPKGAEALEDQKPTAAQDSDDKGDKEQISGQGKPDQAFAADNLEPEDSHPPRAPSPPSSHASEEDTAERLQQAKSSAASGDGKQGASSSSASEAPQDAGKQQGGSKSAFGDKAQRAFSDKLQDSASADLGRRTSSSYTGLNPTGTRSASRLFSSDPPPQAKAAAPMTKRDMVANSILQMQMDNELDTFTADIDCMWDSSDEEEEEQPAAKGKKAEPAKGGKQKQKEGQKAGQKEERKEDSKPEPKQQQQKQEPAQKKKKKAKDEYDEDDEDNDEEVDHANVEDLGSEHEHDKMESMSTSSSDEEEEDRKKDADKRSATPKDDPKPSDKDDKPDDKPDSGSGGGAAASGSNKGQSAGKGSGTGGGQGSSGGGSSKKSGAAPKKKSGKKSGKSKKRGNAESPEAAASVPEDSAAHESGQEGVSDEEAESAQQAESEQQAESSNGASSAQRAKQADAFHAQRPAGPAGDSSSNVQDYSSESAQAGESAGSDQDAQPAQQHLTAQHDESTSDGSSQAAQSSQPAESAASASSAQSRNQADESSAESQDQPRRAAQEQSQQLSQEEEPEMPPAHADHVAPNEHTSAEKSIREPHSVGGNNNSPSSAAQVGEQATSASASPHDSSTADSGPLTQLAQTLAAPLTTDSPASSNQQQPSNTSNAASNTQGSSDPPSGDTPPDDAPLLPPDELKWTVGLQEHEAAAPVEEEQSPDAASNASDSAAPQQQSPQHEDSSSAEDWGDKENRPTNAAESNSRHAKVLSASTSGAATGEEEEGKNSKGRGSPEKKSLATTLEEAAATVPALRTHAQEVAESGGPDTPDRAHPTLSGALRPPYLSESEGTAVESGIDLDSVAAAELGMSETHSPRHPQHGQADGAASQDLSQMDLEFIETHEALLRSTPLTGDQEQLQALEDVSPKTKTEMKAAELQVTASTLYQNGNQAQGEKVQRQVLQFLQKGNAQAALISTAASTLADMLWEQQKYEEAEDALVQACKVCCGTSRSVKRLKDALVQACKHEDEEAKDALVRACKAAKEAGRALHLMKLCNNLGAVQRKKLGKTDSAYAVYKDALFEAMQKFGRASNYTLIARGNVVEETAEIVLQDAAQDLIDATHKLQMEFQALDASTQEGQDKVAELKGQANKAALIASRCFAELGKQQTTSGRDDDAEHCFEQALKLVRAVVAPGHPEAAYALGAFAAFCKNRNTPEYLEQAIDYYQELQQIVEGLHGFENEQNALVYKMMGETYESMGDYSKASECAKQAVQALTGVTGPNNIALQPFWQTVANLCKKAGDKSGSKAAQRKSDKLKKASKQAQVNNNGESKQSKSNGRKAAFSS